MRRGRTPLWSKSRLHWAGHIAAHWDSAPFTSVSAYFFTTISRQAWQVTSVPCFVAVCLFPSCCFCFLKPREVSLAAIIPNSHFWESSWVICACRGKPWKSEWGGGYKPRPKCSSCDVHCWWGRRRAAVDRTPSPLLCFHITSPFCTPTVSLLKQHLTREPALSSQTHPGTKLNRHRGASTTQPQHPCPDRYLIPRIKWDGTLHFAHTHPRG